MQCKKWGNFRRKFYSGGVFKGVFSKKILIFYLFFTQNLGIGGVAYSFLLLVFFKTRVCFYISLWGLLRVFDWDKHLRNIVNF